MTMSKNGCSEECHEFCPYTGLPISFNALFGAKMEFEVENIWPCLLTFYV